ncbi:acetyl-CoA C-acyltransferase [Pseudactinotalea sp. Z1732]|uniref:acetyl-CoA C-acyltransferase n=1 Tax=Pseudactinotalea sp. Z1732 TaxID=3413026 RepID=UPI003C7BD9D2
MSDIVIVAAARTPQGRMNGALSTLPATELGGHAIKAALERGRVPAEAVDAVFMGQVLQAGAGQAPARQAAIAAGVGWRAHATTVNKVCLSGLSAIIDATRLVRSGEAQVVVAGGMESMSLAPHLLTGSRKGWAFGPTTAIDHMAYDGLTDPWSGEAMGLGTDRRRDVFPTTRGEQDALAAASHQRAQAAWQAGRFDAEVAPVTIRTRRGETVVERDEGIRPDTTEESLAKLRPAFTPEGHITAGNASQISDGAAAVVVTTAQRAAAEGWDVLAAVGACGQVAGPDASLQEQPAAALEVALDRQGWAVGEVDLLEINEAFAAVVIGSAARLGVDVSVINRDGGGIALGHPIGASGTRLAVHAAHRIAAGDATRAAVALCGGGGQGEALLLHTP